jgi:hypothetical protein
MVKPVATRRQGGGSRPVCDTGFGYTGPVGYRPVPEGALTEEEKARAADGAGGWYWKTCGGELQLNRDLTRTDSGGTFIPSDSSAPTVNPGELAVEALERAPLPQPQITMAPSPDIPQLVNLATYLWLPAEQWEPETVSATAGGVTSTVTATPMRVVWDMGQGDTVVCNGPGLPYRPDLPDEHQPSDCHYTYRASSAGQPGQAFTVTATVEWETTWAVSGAPGGGSLGTVSRSSSIDVRVAELQSLNVTPLLGAQHGITAAASGQSADH